MKLKCKALYILLLLFFIFIYPLQADKFQDTINCLTGIKSKVNELAGLDQRSNILSKLKQIESNFEKCKIGGALLEDTKKYIAGLKQPNALKREGNKANMQTHVKYLNGNIDRMISTLSQLKNAQTGEKTEKQPGQDADMSVTEQLSNRRLELDLQIVSLKNLVFFVIVLLLVIVVLGLLFYFLSFKKELKELNYGIRKVRDQVKDLTRFVSGAENEILKAVKSRSEELQKHVTFNVDRTIIQLKDLRDELAETAAPPSQHDTRTGDEHPVSPGEQNRHDVQKDRPIETPPLIKIDFPEETVGQGWKNQIISIYKKNKDKIFHLVKKIENGDVITKWLEDIGKHLTKVSITDRLSFFKGIYQSINTMRLRLPHKEIYEEFKDVFLNGFYNVLEIEEFGDVGDHFDPYHHMVVGRSGMGDGDIVRKVVAFGYKKKYTEEPIIKAQVEL